MTVNRSKSSLTVMWSLPYPLNETTVDIWYQVHIRNVTDENNPAELDTSSCANITETQCALEYDNLSHCDQHLVTVTPFSEAGQGNSSEVTSGKSSEWPYQSYLILVLSF